MKAIRIHGPKDARFEEVPTPEPKADEVLVRVRAVAICATDVELYDGVMYYITSGMTKYPFRDVDFDPLVVGEVSILGCLGGPNLWPEAIALHASGKVRTAPIITHRLPLGLCRAARRPARIRPGPSKPMPAESLQPMHRCRPLEG